MKENVFILKARDSLLRSVNHELRAPLTRMKLDLEFLEASEYRDSLSQDVNYIQELIEELMEIEKYKLDQSEMERINLNKLIPKLFDKLKIDENFVTIDLIENSFISGKNYQVEKLFKNLIENANKYKSAEGRINIKSSFQGNKLIINILNEGANIPSSDIPFIFEPFFRSSNSNPENKKGLGLGLNICKEVIDSHKGSIQVSSKKDFGTIFKLSFPK